jgi:hypothetical protein
VPAAGGEFKPVFPDFAAAIIPTAFAPGVVGSGDAVMEIRLAVAV